MENKYIIGKREFVLNSSCDVESDLCLLEERDGISLYKISIRWEKPCSPEVITLSYRVPAVEIYTMWDPIDHRRHIPFSYKITDSRLGCGMPLKCLVSATGENAHLLTVSDVKSPIHEKMKSNIHTGMIDCAIDFFTALTGPFESYEALIRIDERRISYDLAVHNAVSWFEGLGYENPYVPNDAKVPVYSTWYSYGQAVTQADVIKECEVASRLGMKVVILDDGWQTDNTEVVYGYCGDWNPIPSKFPDMAELSDKIHSLGMKLMLWYSVPFVGMYSEKFKEFEGKYLRFLDNANCYVLDPRYKEVREFLVNTYVTAVKEWKLDGLKLDFIDRFKTNGEYNENMDFVSVEDATEQLLEDISTALKKVDPEILIEFRQPYYGPVVSKYGNMMRVWDCPLDGCMNKNQSINLRLILDKCAVHSDMIYWSSEDTPESVALQLWGTVFSVPQISSRFDGITDGQTEVLKNYLDFWVAHRETLTEGKISARLCENGYGYAEAEGDKEIIAILSSSPVAELTRMKNIFLVNLTGSDSLVIKNKTGAEICLRCLDCAGKELSTFSTRDELFEVRSGVGYLTEVCFA